MQTSKPFKVLENLTLSKIEELAEIENLAFVIAVGPAQGTEKTGEDKLVVLVPEKKVKGAKDINIGQDKITTTAILDDLSISLVKYEGCHWFLNPPGILVQC